MYRELSCCIWNL